MRKSILSFVLSLSVMIIPPAFAIEKMSTDVMKKTTGQASVSVRVDNVVIEDVRLSMLYFDDDGISGDPQDAAAIRLKYTHGTKTLRAIFDYTDRGGYLKREYGTLMRRDMTNGGEEHWAGLSTGGEIKPAELTISTSKKLKLHSYMRAFNLRADGLSDAKDAYYTLSSLGIDYSGDETANIDVIMTATGMAERSAKLAYSDASSYAMIVTVADADRLGTEIALRNSGISGVAITLPTLEIRTDFETTSFSIDSEGATNSGAEFIRIKRADSTMAILGGHVEVCKN